MKRDDLKQHGLTDEAMDFVMGEFGKLTEANKNTQTQLAKALADLEAAKQTGATLESAQVEVAKLKADLSKAIAEAQASQKQWRVHDSVQKALAGKKFVNDITRDAVAKQMEEALLKDSSESPDYEAVLKGITDGKANVFVEDNAPSPPVQPQLAATAAQTESGVTAAFRKLNPWHTE